MTVVPRISLRRPSPLNADIRPPGSKSLTNRALLLAAMAEGDSKLTGCLDSDDARLMRTCLHQLGVRQSPVSGDEDEDARRRAQPYPLEVPGCEAPMGHGPTDFYVHGHGRRLGYVNAPKGPLYVGTAGTVARFLSAALAATGARIAVDGSPRMRERPMGSLLDALRGRGATIENLEKSGFLPIYLGDATRGGRRSQYRGGRLVLQEVASSQFVSALAIAACFADSDTQIVLEKGTPARPYVDMTLRTINSFGGRAEWTGGDTIEIEAKSLHGCEYDVEPDASAASYFLGLAAIHGGQVRIRGLGRNSLQGDTTFHEVLAEMGAQSEQNEDSTVVRSEGKLRGAQLEMSAIPDMTLTAAVCALFAEGSTTIRGVDILRHHECDRLAAGATELRKLGATVEEFDDGLKIDPPADGPKAGVEIATYDDHRMAMAFAMVGDVTILDPACSNKTFPRYFDELAQLGMVAGAQGSVR